MRRSLVLPGLAALIALLIVSIGWLLSRSADDGGGVSTAAEDSRSGEAKPLTARPRPSTAEQEPGEVAQERRAIEADDAEVETQPAASADGMITIWGGIVVVDARGVVHRKENGSFLPLLWDDSSGNSASSVEVVDGRFGFRMPAGLRLEIDELILGGRPAFLDSTGPFAVEDGETLSLQARWPEAPILNVVDESTGIPLNGIELVFFSDWDRVDDVHPGSFAPSDRIRSSARSPLRLPAEECVSLEYGSFVVLWARAPGYAWDRIEIDFAEFGEYTLALKPAAELVITLVNHDPTAGSSSSRAPRLIPVLRVRTFRGPPGGSPVDLEELRRQLEAMPEDQFPGGKEAEIAELIETLRQKRERPLLRGDLLLEQRLEPVEGSITITGLAPGPVSVSVEVGCWTMDDQIQLGWASTELEAGRRAQVTLVLEPLPEFEAPAPLSGTLFVPPSWGELDLTLFLDLVDLPEGVCGDALLLRLSEMQPVAGREGLSRWSAGEVTPGRYEICVYQFQYRQVIHVPSDGLLDAHLELGERAVVVVHLLEKETGLPVPMKTVHWNCLSPDGAAGGSTWFAELDEEIGGYRFLAPAGRVEIRSRGDGYERYDQVHEIRPGENEITIYLKRSCGVVLSVREGGETVSFEVIERFIHIEQVSGGGLPIGRWWSLDGVRFHLSNPGLYEIRIDPVEGYLPVEPVRVEVPAGEFVEHVVVLKGNG